MVDEWRISTSEGSETNTETDDIATRIEPVIEPTLSLIPFEDIIEELDSEEINSYQTFLTDPALPGV